MKNNGDNLILGCEEAEEKPLWSIGDECVLSGNLTSAEVIGIYEGMAWVKIEGEAMTVPISHISKPKTEQDKLRDELIAHFTLRDELIAHFTDGNYLDDDFAGILIDEMLEKFNVTEKGN